MYLTECIQGCIIVVVDFVVEDANVVVIFMDVISVVCVNGVDVIVIFEVVSMLVVESLVTKHSDKANKLNSYHIRYYLLSQIFEFRKIILKNKTGKQLPTSFVAHDAIKVLVFLSIRIKVRRIAIYTLSMTPPITMISITFNSSTTWIQAASSLAGSTVCACEMINTNVYATDIRIIDPTSLFLANIICKYLLQLNEHIELVEMKFMNEGL